MLNDQLSKCWLRKSWKSRGDREIFSKILKVERRKRNGSKKEREIIFKSWKSRGERETFPPILENREENETWKLASRERERKIWVISLREFLEIETLVNVCSISPASALAIPNDTLFHLIAFLVFLSDPGLSTGPIYVSGCLKLSEWETLLKLCWCDSGWWRYKLDTNW